MKRVFPAFVLLCVGLVFIGSMFARREAPHASSPIVKTTSNGAEHEAVYAQAR